MDLGIDGKVALVGASANGLGLATAQKLAAEGCHVVLCDFDEAGLEVAKEQLASVGSGEIAGWPVNFRNLDSIENLLSLAEDWKGGVDILVTNSGGPPPGAFDDATDEKWQAAFELTFLSAVRLIRGVLPGMKERNWGRIINFTSRTLREPIDNLMISNAVRLAVAGMAKTLATEVAPFGITVNNLGPGPTSTARTIELATARAEKRGATVEDELSATEARIPVGHMATPEDQASVVAFLASEAARHITGSSLIVDGGETRAL